MSNVIDHAHEALKAVKANVEVLEDKKRTCELTIKDLTHRLENEQENLEVLENEFNKAKNVLQAAKGFNTTVQKN